MSYTVTDEIGRSPCRNFTNGARRRPPLITLLAPSRVPLDVSALSYRMLLLLLPHIQVWSPSETIETRQTSCRTRLSLSLLLLSRRLVLLRLRLLLLHLPLLRLYFALPLKGQHSSINLQCLESSSPDPRCELFLIQTQIQYVIA